MTEPRRRSSSAARRMGDSYQDLVALNYCLMALSPASTIRSIQLEADDTGILDDVVVKTRAGQPNLYIQTKLTVTPERCDLNWLMSPSNKAGESLLERMYRSWHELGEADAKAELITSREASLDDRVFGRRDNKTGRIDDVVAADAALLDEIATHLSASTDATQLFLESTRFTTAYGYTHAQDLIDVQLVQRNIASAESVTREARTIVNDWIQQGRRTVPATEIEAEIGPLLTSRTPAATLIIQAIDADAGSRSADVLLDWQWAFPGSTPYERRGAITEATWNDELWPALLEGVRHLDRAQGNTIAVGGKMRLSCWFASGAALTHSTGTEVACLWGPRWSSTDSPVGAGLETAGQVDIGRGPETALAVGLTTDITADVVAHIQNQSLPISRLHTLSLASGTGNRAVASGGHAVTIAESLRNHARDLGTSELIHLFMAVPAGVALLAGHLWNHTPQTQLYEPLGAGMDYQPSFRIGRR